MVPHHERGIAMARTELKDGQNAELKKLASGIVSSQAREVREMRAHAKGGSGDSGDTTDHTGGGNGY
jgi:uncharacterized protein (DUF305 family)